MGQNVRTSVLALRRLTDVGIRGHLKIESQRELRQAQALMSRIVKASKAVSVPLVAKSRFRVCASAAGRIRLRRPPRLPVSSHPRRR